MILIVFCKIAFAENAPSLFQEGGTNSLIATIDTFSITVNDQVRDGCLPNPRGLKDKMEISLRKNGYKISDENDLPINDIYISAVGGKTPSTSCVVSLSVDLRFLTASQVPFTTSSKDKMTLVYSRYHIGDGLHLENSNSMQTLLNKEISYYGDKLYLDISRAQDDIFTKFPSIKKEYEESKK